MVLRYYITWREHIEFEKVMMTQMTQFARFTSFLQGGQLAPAGGPTRPGRCASFVL